VKEFLSREGYPFTARDVEEDHEAYSALLALGFRSVPVTVVDGVGIKGFDEPALRHALRGGTP
jgi:glutaredoxin